MRKIIFHLDMDSFFVSVERILNPELIGKPVIVGGPPNSRGVVSCASYEARKYGVHSAMPSSRAHVMCPKAIFVFNGLSLYSEYSEMVKSILVKFFPVVNQTSIDEFYLDYSGCERLYGKPFFFAKKLKKIVTQETNLPFSIGIGSNKLVAKIASKLAKPNGILYVFPDNEEAFLSPLPINILQGIGKVTNKKMQELGIKKVADIKKIPYEYLKTIFGKMGTEMIQKSKGIYTSKRGNISERKSLSKERTFDKDHSDKKFLVSIIFYLVEKSTYKLRKLALSPKKITLKIRYSDFKTTSSTSVIRAYASDIEIFYRFRELFQKLYTRRVGLRLIGVKFSHFIKTDQPTFDITGERNIDKQNLYKKIDSIRDQFGFDAINFASIKLI